MQVSSTDSALVVSASFVFFFKQKTAYEMRISDWSADVCSSDLERTSAARCFKSARLKPLPQESVDAPPALECRREAAVEERCPHACHPLSVPAPGSRGWRVRRSCADSHPRSEEHTSELQSLMRISYDVCCLQTKNKQRHKIHTTH